MSQEHDQEEADLLALTKGRRKDKGWKRDSAGRCIGSVDDRRRLVVEELTLRAQRRGASSIIEGCDNNDLKEIARRWSIDEKDYLSLGNAFMAWVNRL